MPSRAGPPGHIAINAVFLRPRMGGLETMVRRLLPELVRQAPGSRISVFVGPEGRTALADEPWLDAVTIQTHPLLGRPGGKAISELALLGLLAPRRGVDVLYSIALTGPLSTRVAHVVNVADTIWITHPDTGDMATMRLWRLVVPPVARRADRVIAISKATRDDIVRHLHVPAGRIDVAYLGAGTAVPALATPAAEVRERFALGDGPIVLSVSAKKPHKNLMRAVRAMRAVADRRPDAMLVIPGNPTDHEQELREEAARLDLDENVRFPAWVSDQDLEGLYAAAACSLVPSLNEGFGLSVVESMRRGVPVAAADAASLPEVGGDAARYFDPLDEQAIARTVLELIEDEPLRARLIELGRAQAATFSWERCAQETLESLTRAWAERRR